MRIKTYGSRFFTSLWSAKHRLQGVSFTYKEALQVLDFGLHDLFALHRVLYIFALLLVLLYVFVVLTQEIFITTDDVLRGVR